MTKDRLWTPQGYFDAGFEEGFRAGFDDAEGAGFEKGYKAGFDDARKTLRRQSLLRDLTLLEERVMIVLTSAATTVILLAILRMLGHRF